MAQHGGGYIYSVCPKSQPLTEDCFNQNILSFVGSTHTIRFLDGRPELEIPARDVSVGTFPSKSAWRINPIPACNCDFGRGCSVGAKSPKSRAYTNETAKNIPGCPTGLQFGEDAPFKYGDGQQIWDRPGTQGEQVQEQADDWVIVDTVKAPATPGEFVLRWRWDCEQNPQVVRACMGLRGRVPTCVQPFAESSVLVANVCLLVPVSSFRSGQTAQTSLYSEPLIAA